MRILAVTSSRVRIFFIFILWAATCIAKYKFNGEIFGFDYSNLQPDGKHYAFRTLIFMGNSESDAARQVITWYDQYAPRNSGFALSDMASSTNAVWGLVAPRVLYSILSIPFVWIFGLQGMLMIPALSLLAIYLSVDHLAKKMNAANLGTILILLISCSTTIYRWMFSNCTDALLAGLFALTVIVLQQSKGVKQNTNVLVLIFLSSITRFCLPIWIAISIFLFFRYSKRLALVVLGAASLFSIPTFMTMPQNTLIPSIQDASTVEKVLRLPISLAKVTFVEFAELAVLDRVLLFMLLASLAISIRNFRNDASLLYLLVLGSVFLIGAINGTLGVNFRYQLPAIPFMALVFLKNSKSFSNFLKPLKN